MTATLADGAMQDRAHSLINRGLIALIRQMLGRNAPAVAVIADFTAAGLMHMHRDGGTTILAMDGLSGHGTTLRLALQDWLSKAEAHHNAHPCPEVATARLQ